MPFAETLDIPADAKTSCMKSRMQGRRGNLFQSRRNIGVGPSMCAFHFCIIREFMLMRGTKNARALWVGTVASTTSAGDREHLQAPAHLRAWDFKVFAIPEVRIHSNNSVDKPNLIIQAIKRESAFDNPQSRLPFLLSTNPAPQRFPLLQHLPQRFSLLN